MSKKPNFKSSGKRDQIINELFEIFSGKFGFLESNYYYDEKNKSFVNGKLTTIDDYFDVKLLDIIGFKIESFDQIDNETYFLDLIIVLEDENEISVENYIDNYVEDNELGKLFIKEVEYKFFKQNYIIQNILDEFSKYIIK